MLKSNFAAYDFFCYPLIANLEISYTINFHYFGNDRYIGKAH
jgi:hypothetical protein